MTHDWRSPPTPPAEPGGAWAWPLTKGDLPRHAANGPRRIWPLLNWIALGVVLIGTALAYVGFQRVVTPPPVLHTLETPIRTVAGSVPADATATNSIGQQRVVRTSNGYLLSLFATPEGLRVVSDLGDHGRSWRAPLTIPAIQASSLSATIDDHDRVHVAFVNEKGPAFTVLSRSAAGWQPSNIVQLEEGSSPVIDVAWDQGGELAHIAWVAQRDGTDAVSWASFSSGDVAKLVETEELASGFTGTALANVAAAPDGRVIVTYRKGDAAGWYSRLLLGESGWQPEEALPTKIRARAGSVALDRRGIAHLVLIDDAGREMIYLRRSNKGWAAPQTIVPSGTTEQMDDPFLAADSSSRLLYAFFSTTGTADALRVVVNDPATGWEDVYRVSVEDNSTQGRSPTSMDPLVGTPLLLWTSTDADPALQSGNIVLP